MSTLILRPTNLHWLSALGVRATPPHDPLDLCAHSPVDFRIGDQVIVAPSDGVWSVSASAIYLLRTLSMPHTRNSQVGEHLFPHCGSGIFDVEDSEDALIVGCSAGIDVQVTRAGDDAVVKTYDGRSFSVPFSAWTRAVCAFSDRVFAFYQREPPRQPHDEGDRGGFQKMMAEWSRRRLAAEGGGGASGPAPTLRLVR